MSTIELCLYCIKISVIGNSLHRVDPSDSRVDTIYALASASATNHTTDFVEDLGGLVHTLLTTTVYPACTLDEVQTLSEHFNGLMVRNTWPLIG